MVRFQLISLSSYAKNKLQMCSISQHQCRRRQMCGNIFTNSPSTLTFCLLQKKLSSLNNLFMVRFQLIRMSSLVKNKLQMVTLYQCWRRQMWGKYSQIHPVHSLFICYKNDLSWLNNIFMVRFQLISLSSYAKNKLQMCSVTQHQCRWRQMWKSF